MAQSRYAQHASPNNFVPTNKNNFWGRIPSAYWVYSSECRKFWRGAKILAQKFGTEKMFQKFRYGILCQNSLPKVFARNGISASRCIDPLCQLAPCASSHWPIEDIQYRSPKQREVLEPQRIKLHSLDPS